MVSENTNAWSPSFGKGTLGGEGDLPAFPTPFTGKIDAFALGLLAAREVWIRAPVFNLEPKLQMRKEKH